MELQGTPALEPILDGIMHSNPERIHIPVTQAGYDW
jgi:hypothetical protein